MSVYSDNGVSRIKAGVYLGLGLAAFMLLWGTFFVVQPGEIAVKTRLGQVMDSYGEGLHFKLPVIDAIHRMSMRISRDDIKTDAFSKDLQTMQVHLAINHRIEKENAISVYRNLGARYMETIIDPAAQEVLKAITARHTAEMIVSSRAAIVEAVNADLKAKLKEKQIIVTDVSIVDMDFTQGFLGAVERKQIAEQDAKTAQNLVEKAKREADSKVAAARAEAESLRLQKEVVTPLMVQLRQIEVNSEAIKKWDGRLPTYTGGAIPMLNLNK